jgi:hypothetical protein
VPDRAPAPSRGLVAALYGVALALLAHLGFGVFRAAMDFDEFHFLHGGWLVAQGRRPYLDFWDDHGPLIHVLISLFYRAGGSGDAAALFFHRAVLFGLLLASAAGVHRIARELRPGDAAFPALALALFAASPILGHKGIEARSDNLLQPIWILSLGLWLRAARSGRSGAFALAGLAVGAGFLVTPKTSMLGVAAGCMFAVWMLARRRFELRALAAYGAGSLAGPLALVLWVWSAGAWDGFVGNYVTESLTRARLPLAQGFVSLRQEAPLASALAVCATGVVALRLAQRRLATPVACVFACAAALVGQYLFLLPVHFSHSLIPAVGPVALVIAWALAEVFLGAARRPAPLRQAALLAAVCAVALYEGSARRYDGRTLARQLARAQRIASLVPPGALLFDGGTLAVEYPRPLPAFSLVMQVQRQIASGRFPVDVEAELDRRDVAWWRTDGRARSLEHRLARYRAEHFLPLDGDLWVAGQRVERRAGGRATLDVRVAAAYWWEAPGGELRIDGRLAANPVVLSDGRHEAEWSGQGALLLAAAPPERWSASLRRAGRGRPP